MKKILSVLLASLMLLSCITVTSFAANDITVTLNGEVVDCNAYGQPATIVESRTLVPLRAIFEALGASVDWDQATKTVSSSMGDTTISLTVGSNVLIKNGASVELDVPAQIINGRTLVPARAIAEAYGVVVDWDSATRTVILVKAEDAKDDNGVKADTFVKYSEAYSTGTESIQTVPSPTDSSKTVYYMKSNMETEICWTYFWVPATLEASKKYVVEYDVYLESDALGNEVTYDDASFGTCFSYGDLAENEGKSAHHGNTIDGKSAKVVVTPGEWKHIIYVYEMPATLNPEVRQLIGIFGNPVEVAGYPNKLSVNFYVDNFSVREYNGNAENGLHLEGIIEPAVAPDSIDDAQGIVYDFTTDVGTLEPSRMYDIVDGCLVMDSVGDKDPRIIDKTVSFSATEYPAVMARVKFDQFISENPDYSARFSVYFATDADPDLSQNKTVNVKYEDNTPDADGFYTLFFDMTTNASWNGNINTIRFDVINGEGVITVDKIVIVKA